MRQIYFLFIFLLIPFFGFSQNTFTITGSVLDKDQSPLLYGDVLLLSGKDSLPLGHTSIEDGQFVFNAIKAGSYIININCLSYEKVYQSVQINADQSLSFTLTENANSLSEATVTAQRNTIVNENGNIKISIANSMYAIQSSTTDMLAQLPTVLVGSDRESISIIGKGAPLIYLENQRITTQELNSIPVETIQSVEIINNPSAKYEANGRAVLLIKRIPSLSDGYNIQLSETAAFRRRFNNYANLNANFKKNKLELRTNFAYNSIILWEGHHSTLQLPVPDIEVQENAVSTGARPQFVMGGGIHYQLNKNEYISAHTYNRSFVDNSSIETSSVIRDTTTTNAIESLSDDGSNRGFFSTNLNYNKKFKAANLFAGAQYSFYRRDLTNAISNNYNDTEYIPEQNRFQDFTTDAYSFRLDFEKTFANSIKWEIGTNIYYADANAYSEFSLAGQNEKTISNYDYKEQNLAGYTQLSGKKNKVSYSFGLRSETIDAEGKFRSQDSLLIDRHRTVLFPKALISFPIDSSKTITINYAKSIQRPHYLNTSSISTFISPYVEYTRNVNLKSSITQEVSVSLQYKNQSLNLRYFERDDPVNTSMQYNETENRIKQMPENFDNEIGGSLQLVSPFNYKFWNVTNVVMLSFGKTEDNRSVEIATKPYLYLYTNNTFRLPSKMTFGISYFWIGKRQTGIFEMQPISSLNLSFSKTFYKNWTFQIQFNDVFRGMEWRNKYTVNEIHSSGTNFSDIKSLAFTLRYSFGKILKSNYKNKDVDEQLDRMK